MRTGHGRAGQGTVEIFVCTCLVAFLFVAGCTGDRTGTIPVKETPGVGATQSLSSSSGQDRWIEATLYRVVYNTGDMVTVEGRISGSNGPVSYSVHTVQDAMGNDFRRGLVTGRVMPADGAYSFSFVIQPATLPVGSYVIRTMLPTNEWTKVQFLVEARGVDCVQVCSQPGPALRYNEKGEAICPC